MIAMAPLQFSFYLGGFYTSPFTSSLLNSTALQDMTVYSTNTLGHFLLPISNREFRISFVLLHHFSLTFFIGMDRRQDVRRLDARF